MVVTTAVNAARNANNKIVGQKIGRDNYKIDNTETNGAPAFAVKAITTQAQMLEDGANGVSVKNQKLTLIPYYAWNHRGADQMNVWFVQSLKMLDK